MTKKKTNKPKKDEKPRVNKELEGFYIEIDAFGEIKTNYDINKINEFLNREVDDKKLRHRKNPYKQKESDEIDEEQE
jgi:hypothetical protein